ncbi:MAG: O-phosphoseryl-tRNA(Sec) selenium transferase [Candidatus Lokiarchaeota archaeon]|nr:O-phosphoseryl-tRNA(Sec) selenium transferase [Candidatus Lokiarchaeota archaeon]
MFDLEKLKNILKNTKIPQNMLNRGMVGLNSFLKPIENVLNQMKPADKGWTDNQIKFFLEILAQLDSNNDPESFRIGEREARVSTQLLYNLSGGFIHGIGRSGDIKAPQPKAAGGSVLNFLTDAMVSYMFKHLGLENIAGSRVVPLSTGMTLMLTIRGLYEYQKKTLNNQSMLDKNKIIFPRMDHKSPIKAINLASMKNITVESVIGKDYVENENADSRQIEFIKKWGKEACYVLPKYIENAIDENTFGIISTTSFFPPRSPDNIKEIAKISEKYNLVHIINNAYGVQSLELMKLLRSAIDAGRVDAIIQSTDKNFLTPVGGAIISSPKNEVLDMISKVYAGRGSSAPILHLFVSLLAMGIKGYDELIKMQKDNRQTLEKELKKVANEINERVLNVNNPVACIMTLENLSDDQVKNLGGYLYNLRVTGPRVVNPKLKSFGTSTNHEYPPYLVMNAAIGVSKSDILGAISQLKKAIKQVENNS